MTVHKETLSIYAAIEMEKGRCPHTYKKIQFCPPKQWAASVCCIIFVILPSSANIMYSQSSKFCSLTPFHKIFVHNITPHPLTVTKELQHRVHNAVMWPCELSYSFVCLRHSVTLCNKDGIHRLLKYVVSQSSSGLLGTHANKVHYMGKKKMTFNQPGDLLLGLCNNEQWKWDIIKEQKPTVFSSRLLRPIWLGLSKHGHV